MNTRSRFALAAIATAATMTGCISVSVGKPEHFSKEFYGGEQPARVISSKCLGAEPTVDAGQLAKGRLAIGLKGKIETKSATEKVYKTINIERQKKLDFGICPGVREMLDFGGKKNPDHMIAMVGANFDPDSKVYENRMGSGFGWSLGAFLGTFLMIPYAVVVEPVFGDWSCSTHHWVLPETPLLARGVMQFFASEAGDRQKALEIISSSEFEPLGVKTYVNSGTSHQSPFASTFTHMALLGFHKRSVVRVHPIEITRREPTDAIETSTANAVVGVGPFKVRLSIPSLHYDQTVEVPKGRSLAWFNDLPDGAGAGTQVKIRFEASGSGVSEATTTLLDTASAKEYAHTL